MIKFPKDFFWGAATSAYQVEGQNTNSDWWEWEKKVGLKEPSGEACRHYTLYKQDFDLARSLNHNAHRLSIEWSRIEPQDGCFSSQAIEHYKDVVHSLRELNIEPVVTLHHFTNPIWFAKLGGWSNEEAVRYFLRYVEKIVEALCFDVKFWVTINEPLVYVYYSYIVGEWPPEEKSLTKARKVINNFSLAHIKTYRVIHNIYNKKILPRVSVSIAQNVRAFEVYSPSLKNIFAAYLRNKKFNFDFIDKLARAKAIDFIGINYYTRESVEARGLRLRNLFLDVSCANQDKFKKNSLGWDIYPEGLYKLLIKLKKYHLPIFILENGICTDNDSERWDFIYEHLKNVHLAIEEGVHILGYIYWSLIDNFEWDKGFGPRFGLIDVNYKTYARTIRESALKFARTAKTGILER